LTSRSLKATLRPMFEVRKTDVFAKWIDGLRDIKARARILIRVERLIAGNPGDVRAVGHGISELRINYGPGYRVYFKQHGRKLIILLAGGDKDSQSKDISMALDLVQTL
jgi:putative addiction module killer protein